MTLAELNGCDCGRFVETVGWVFEGSPWVAERAWRQRPFETVDALHDAMIAQVTAATREEQLALVRAHPDLGTRARMSDASKAEQAGAGLGALTPEEFERLGTLNASYRDRFGFPFLYAVKDATKHDILIALERRLAAPVSAELGEALRQVYRIARFRLEALAS